MPFPSLRAETQEVAAAYGAERTPEIFLFDENGRLRSHGAPDDSYEEAQASVPYLRDAVEAVLAGEEPPVQDTPPGTLSRYSQRGWKGQPGGGLSRLGGVPSIGRSFWLTSPPSRGIELSRPQV